MIKPNYSLLLMALLLAISAFAQNDDKGPKPDSTKKEKEKKPTHFITLNPGPGYSFGSYNFLPATNGQEEKIYPLS